ncbi:hypothetical protein [Streptomonospora litoralis]|uniref:Zinc-finger domain-containing protein n=1 Tax=Streptomonospora litoralis TaxID=2498135 RepID=A0A4P6Q7P0_9ACTN|nr:hypothetical protein [Streptomonospora litoralis]QBI56733.1 hypothetical protein EKD16_24960 [Streptomonospora litoralis]
MTSHVDAETLALSAEGLLEDTEESTVQRHVADCAVCAAQRSELAEVTRVLAEVPATPLPDDVAARLDDALRAEADTRRNGGGPPEPESSTGGGAAAGGGGSAAGDGAGVVPLHRRFGSSHRWINYLAVAAAAVVVVGGGSAVVRNLATGETAGAPLAGPGGGVAESSTHGESALSYHPLVVRSGTVYSEDRLSEQAAAVLDRSDTTAPQGAQGDAEGSGAGDRPQTSEVSSEVSSCVQKLAGESRVRPVLIDFAEFSSGAETSGAWVMYYGSEPGSEAHGSYDVKVVAPECGAEGTAADQTVLARATVPAP